ncbi:MAG: hypothetical protein ACOY45_04310 [Pseudomonadota bacterium]
MESGAADGPARVAPDDVQWNGHGSALPRPLGATGNGQSNLLISGYKKGGRSRRTFRGGTHALRSEARRPPRKRFNSQRADFVAADAVAKEKQEREHRFSPIVRNKAQHLS